MTTMYDAFADDPPETIRKAWIIASKAADKFRDALCQAFELDEHPGDDALIYRLLCDYGKADEPESHAWRDRCAALTDQIKEINDAHRISEAS